MPKIGNNDNYAPQAFGQDITAKSAKKITDGPLAEKTVNKVTTPTTTTRKAKKLAEALPPPVEVKRDLRPLYPKLLTLLTPDKTGLLGTVIPQAINHKDLGPILKELLTNLNCETEKKIIETGVSWLNTRPTQLGTADLVKKMPDDESGFKARLLNYVRGNQYSNQEMELQIRDVLNDIGTSLYTKILNDYRNPQTPQQIDYA